MEPLWSADESLPLMSPEVVPARLKKACTAVLLTGFVIAVFWPRYLYKIAGDTSSLWFNPTPGHRAANGVFVADTWDHFQLPSCVCKPNVKELQVPPGTQCATWWGELFWKQDCSNVSCQEDEEKDAGETKLKTKCITTKAAMFAENPGIKECCYNLKTAEQVHRNEIAAHWQFVGRRKAKANLLIWQGQHRCGAHEFGVDFQGSDIGRNWWGGGSSGDCQKACTYTPGCKGFSWCQQCGCWLKKYKYNTSDFIRVPKDNIYSGYACKFNELPYDWLWDEKAKFNLPQVPAPQAAPPASMLCIEVIAPYSYEMGLVTMQYKKNISIFQCDLYAVYSNQVFILPGGLRTRKLNSSQLAEAGGQWGCALNTGIFMALWRAVILDGDYLKASWIIKVDPDTVWFPIRLQGLLRQHNHFNPKALQGHGVSLLNCNQNGRASPTLHGPLEIFSQNALITFANHSVFCFNSLHDWGDWQWGEDAWIDTCMSRFTDVSRVYQDELLAEDHCNRWPGWRSCEADKVAFHPFKNLNEYVACVESAQRSATSSPTSTTPT